MRKIALTKLGCSFCGQNLKEKAENDFIEVSNTLVCQKVLLCFNFDSTIIS